MKLYYVQTPTSKKRVGRHGRMNYDSQGRSPLLSLPEARSIMARVGGRMHDVDFGDIGLADIAPFRKHLDAVREFINSIDPDAYSDDALQQEVEETRRVKAKAYTKPKKQKPSVDVTKMAEDRAAREVALKAAQVKAAATKAHEQAQADRAERAEKLEAAEQLADELSEALSQSEDDAQPSEAPTEAPDTSEEEIEAPEVTEEAKKEITPAAVENIADEAKVEFPSYNTMRAAIAKADKDDNLDFDSSSIIGSAADKESIQKAYLLLQLKHGE